MGTFWEVLCLHLYAKGLITSNYEFVLDRPLITFCWIFLCPFWRDAHFYFVHRVMHPWNTVYMPDVGQFLYDHGHYLHHKSTNFTAWSGVSMHPVEGIIYMTGMIVPCFFSHHAILLWIIKIDLIYKAVLGHDGYDFPG